MPYELNYENDGRGVVVYFTGVLSGSEIYEVNEHIYAKGRLPKLRYQIWDFTKVKTLNLLPFEVRDFAMQDRRAAEQNPNMVGALVGDTKFFGGLQHVYKVFAEVWARGFKYEIFSNMEEARAWIAKEIPEMQI